MHPSTYRIIASETGDWYIAAKMVGGVITELYANHNRDLALEAIIKDMGISLAPTVRRKIEDDGSYELRPEDWEG